MNNIINKFLILVTLVYSVSLSSCDSEKIDDSTLTIEFESPTTQVSENSNSSIFIPLKLEGSSNQEVLVTYEVSGTADFPADVTPLTSTTFLIPAGASAFNIEMLVLEDLVVELDPETLIIELISVSTGGELGTQATHELTIEADNITLVSFAKESTNTVPNSDVTVEVVLSKPYSEDLEIRLSLDMEFSSIDEYPFNDVGYSVIIEAGQTSGTLYLYSNPGLQAESVKGKIIAVSIWEVRTVSGTNVKDAIRHVDDTKLEHLIAISNGGISAEMSWVSSTKDVDLDLFLFDSNTSIVLSASTKQTESIESIVIPTEDIPDGTYRLAYLWIEGTGPTDLEIKMTPGYAKWEGGFNSLTYIGDNRDKPSNLEDYQVIFSIVKNGSDFTLE